MLSITLKVIISSLIISPFLLIFWWVTAAFLFGLNFQPTMDRFLLYILISLPPAAMLFAKVLKMQFKELNGKLTYLRAFIVSIVSLLFLQLSMVLITFYQFGNDITVFLGGVSLSLISAVALLLILSRKLH